MPVRRLRAGKGKDPDLPSVVRVMQESAKVRCVFDRSEDLGSDLQIP